MFKHTAIAVALSVLALPALAQQPNTAQQNATVASSKAAARAAGAAAS